MKILMLGWELPPHNSGGLGVACLNLSKALAEAGAQIDFVVPYKSQHEVEFMKVLPALSLDPLVRYGAGAYSKIRLQEAVAPVKNSGQMLSIREIQHDYCDFVKKYLLEYCPDVVHAHDWLTYEAGILAKRDYGIPLIAHVHATEFDRAGGRGNALIHAIEREALLLADRVIAVSAATKRLIHERYKIPLNKIDVVYNSLGEDFLQTGYNYNNEQYHYLERLKEQGYTIVTTVGRFTLQKGLWYFLRAAALAIEREPRLIFVLAGDGEERNKLLAQVAELGIAENVIFTGFVRGKRLRDIYSVSDIFVMSSQSEPFGLTALEAAHHGNALIMTKQSGAAELLHSAMKYDFWDERKLADEIVAIAHNATLLRSLRDGVQQEYHKLSWQDVANKCLKIYQKMSQRRLKGQVEVA